MKKNGLVAFFLLITLSVFAQLPSLERVEPSFWWTGMKNPDLQLLVHGKDISLLDPHINYPGVTLKAVHRVANPNYLFIDLKLSETVQSGSFFITFQKKGAKQLRFSYELRQRDRSPDRIQGVTNKDLIYLIMPDRFANGDTGNDIVKGMKETALNRDSMYYRHGGDIQGIINKLDYLQDLGITTLWLNPVLENDQPKTSYHGYANTENYKIDRRYGNNELYKKLVDLCHNRGMTVIKDLVHNHIGSEHWLMKDMPDTNWVHNWDKFTKSSFKDQVLFDPYASKIDRKIMTDGWFDLHMPDMNQKNPFVRKYFTQSHIWWIEYAGLDAFRLDTYAYNDAEFMAEWGKFIKDEYPRFTFFGETWVHGMPNQVYFTQGNTINRGFDTHLQGVTDFQSLWAINEALNGTFGWNEGVTKLYTTIASDFMYEDASRNVVFLDNHDLSRFFSVIGEDMKKFKSGIAWLLTTRGIPQLYYGTEILMKNFSSPDGLVREDFKGGWKEDKLDKFTEAGRNALEREAFNFVRTLANYRKKNEVLQTGKLMQYVPEEGVYVYFRYNDQKTVMVIMNSNDKENKLLTKRFTERMADFGRAVDVVTGVSVPSLENINVPAKTTLVLELQN